jgi:hypothetical protein
MKPTLIAPGTKRSKLKHDEPLSKIAFRFNLRRCNLLEMSRDSFMGVVAAAAETSATGTIESSKLKGSGSADAGIIASPSPSREGEEDATTVRPG